MARGKEMIAVVGISGVLDKSLDRAVETAQKKINGINPKALKAASAVAGIGSVALKVGTEAIQMGDDFNKAMNDLQAKTGASDKEMEKLGKVAKNVYKNNYGESIDDVAQGVAEVERQTKLSGKALQKMTEGAYALSDTFDYDFSESTRAASAIMKNFGTGGEEALSLIAAGAQNGLDYSGELLDSISEYSVQFGKLGFSADAMFSVFQQGADSGAWNLDKVGDAVKEFSIRAIDGSDSTIGAYEKLGLNAEKTMQKFAAGGDTANESFKKVVNKLMSVDDAVERDAIGVALFGTMWEDLGTDAIEALAKASDGAYDTKNSMKGIQEVKYDSLGDALEGIRRTMEVALLPAASKLANKLNDLAPTIEKVLNFAIDHSNILLPITGSLGTAIAGLKIARVAKEVAGYGKAAGTAAGKVAQFIKQQKINRAATKNLNTLYGKTARQTSTVSTLYGKSTGQIRRNTTSLKIHTVATKVWNGVQKAASFAARGLGAAFRFMTGPIGIAITVITAMIAAGVLLYKNWDKVKAKATEIAKKVKGAFKTMKDGVVKIFKGMRDRISSIFSGLGGLIKKPLNGAISLANKAIDGINNLKSFSIAGKEIQIGSDIPHIPQLATGGITNGPTIAGEGAFDEYVITPDPRYRAQNLTYWQQAGRALGAEDVTYTLGGSSAGANINLGGVQYNPTVEINGNADRDDVLAALRQDREEFMDMLEEWLRERTEYVYG